MKKQCRKCKRFFPRSKFFDRRDRIGEVYAFCKTCMRKTPLYVSVLVNGEYVPVLEKTSRELDYPAEEDRGYGKVNG